MKNAEENEQGNAGAESRTLEQVNREYEQLATFLGDIEAKLAMLSNKKTTLLRRIFELDAEAGRLTGEAK